MRHLYYSTFLSKVLLVKNLHIPKFYRLLFILYTYCTFFVLQWSLINWDKNLPKILLKYAMVWKCIQFKFGTKKASPRLKKKKKRFAVKLAYFFLVLCSLTTLSTNIGIFYFMSTFSITLHPLVSFILSTSINIILI